MSNFRFVASDRRVREDRRFVAGKGQYVADIDLSGMLHVGLVTCPHAAARIKAIDKRAALKMPGVHYVLDGIEHEGQGLVVDLERFSGVFSLRAGFGDDCGDPLAGIARDLKG